MATKPITSAFKRLEDDPVFSTLTGAQRMDVVMLLKEHARAAAQRVKANQSRLLAEQRQMCMQRAKNAVLPIVSRSHGSFFLSEAHEAIDDACLNAVEESGE